MPRATSETSSLAGWVDPRWEQELGALLAEGADVRADDRAAIGGVLAVGGIPRALFLLFGGAFSDRFSIGPTAISDSGPRCSTDRSPPSKRLG